MPFYEENHEEMTISFEHDTEEGCDWVDLPAVYEDCDRCRGTGSHTNPSIDGNGITASEMYELGPDFQRDYMRGVYDVQCYDCKGRRKVLVVDEARADKEALSAFNKAQEDEWHYEAMCASERRYGC